jgi:hypothetical protein
MRETLPQLCREPNVGMIGHTLHPALRHLGVRDAIEGGVDLHGIKILSQVAQGIEASRLWLGIDLPCPVRIGPARRPDADAVRYHGIPAHGSFFASRARRSSTAIRQLGGNASGDDWAMSWRMTSAAERWKVCVKVAS